MHMSNGHDMLIDEHHLNYNMFLGRMTSRWSYTISIILMRLVSGNMWVLYCHVSLMAMPLDWPINGEFLILIAFILGIIRFWYDLVVNSLEAGLFYSFRNTSN